MINTERESWAAELLSLVFIKPNIELKNDHQKEVGKEPDPFLTAGSLLVNTWWVITGALTTLLGY